MNNKRRFLSIVLSIVLTISLASGVPVSAASKAKINRKKVTITVGKTVNLKIKNNKKKVQWKSSNKKVATVSKKGKV